MQLAKARKESKQKVSDSATSLIYVVNEADEWYRYYTCVITSSG